MGKIQIHRAGLTVSASNAEMADLSKQFQQQHAIVLEQFVEPGLLAQVQEAVDRAEFVPRRHGDLGLELCMTEESLAIHMLQLLTNTPRVFALMERITGCPTIGYYEGRIYRLPPSPEFFDKWHNDLYPGRQAGMSINLGAEPYRGGLFELREGGKLRFRAANTVPGNALLFSIQKGLKHRVTAVEGATPKTAFAGWFLDTASKKPYVELLRDAVSPKIVRC